MHSFRTPAHLLQLWNRLRASYWFVPSTIIAGGYGLAYAMLKLDTTLGYKYVVHLSFVYTRDPAGARALLSVISESMITVAGVVFSITVVALTLASNQFGTRVLKSFARDTGNQVVLGTFLGTFLYGLVVMRRVEGHDVPALAVAMSMFLAMAGVAVLVYFIHHVINAIQAENVVAAVAGDLYDTMDVLFPEEIGKASPPVQDRLHAAEAAMIERTGMEIRSERDGFVLSVDADKLLRLARSSDAVIRLLVRPGGFVNRETTLARIWCGATPPKHLGKKLNRSISIGSQRTYDGDLGFGLQQLSLIAVRSLSPAINALGSALDAIDRLTASLVRIGNRVVPSPYRRDDDGKLRVITPALDFQVLLDSILDPVRHAARENPTVVAKLMQSLAGAARNIQNGEMRNLLWQHVDRLLDCSSGFPQELDRRRIHELYHRLRYRDAA